MKPKPSYTPARLVAVSGTTAKEKLAKRWFVVYYIWSEARQEKVRKRIEVTGDTIKARQEEAQQVIDEINALLESGAVIDPVETLAPVKPVPSEESEQVLSTHTLLKTAFVDYFLKIKKAELKQQSYTSYKKAARKFEMFLDKQKTPMRVRDFNEDLAHRFATFLKLHSSKDGGEIGNKSFNNYRGTVFTFCEFLISKRLLKANPMKVIRTLNEQSGSHLPFTDEQVQEMKRVCLEELQDVQLWVFVNFLYYTYMRPHEEARLLKVSDIGKRTIRISPQTGKTNVVRHVNIPPGLEDIIEQSGLRNYPPHHYVFSGDGRPGEFFVSENYFYRKHVTLLEALDMYGFGYTLYGWKHTGVCAYYRATKDIIAIKEQCGHSSIEQTYQYLRDLGLLAEQADMTAFPTI